MTVQTAEFESANSQLLSKYRWRVGRTMSVPDPEPPFVPALGCKRRSHNFFACAAYSITSSARSRIDGGTASPSAFAVLAFNTVSNLID